MVGAVAGYYGARAVFRNQSPGPPSNPGLPSQKLRRRRSDFEASRSPSRPEVTAKQQAYMDEDSARRQPLCLKVNFGFKVLTRSSLKMGVLLAVCGTHDELSLACSYQYVDTGLLETVLAFRWPSAHVAIFDKRPHGDQDGVTGSCIQLHRLRRFNCEWLMLID